MASVNRAHFDDSNWSHRKVTVGTSELNAVRINFISCGPPNKTPAFGIILLIHGFPQTSYQFRHVITPLANAGYTVIVPDYRGAGQSSRPATGYTKSIMASDLMHFMEKEFLQGSKKKIHVVGHDIGGMIAHAYASRNPDKVASVVWGECPLPGTSAYEEDKKSVAQFHFTFHAVPDLPEALVAGREAIYLQHFFEKISYNGAAISQGDLAHYAFMYAQPGAMRCGFELYRAFEEDAKENKQWLQDNGKCKVPCLVLSGERSRHAEQAKEMASEFYASAEVGLVEEAGHYLAEENPDVFARRVLDFVGRHSSD